MKELEDKWRQNGGIEAFKCMLDNVQMGNEIKRTEECPGRNEWMDGDIEGEREAGWYTYCSPNLA